MFVEGATDRELFTWVLNKLPTHDYPLLFVRQAKFEDFGGVTYLSGFLRATYQFIRNEYACVAVFDGDDAGEKRRKELQGYFGQNAIPFEANKHYVSVRSKFPIEGLFPDEWIKSVYDTNSSWFDFYSVDAEEQLEPFKIKDDKKPSLHNNMISRAEAESNLEWASRFINVLKVIDKALDSLNKSLVG